MAAKIAQLQMQLDTARGKAQPKLDAVAAAEDGSKGAESKRADLAKSAREAASTSCGATPWIGNCFSRY